MKSDIRIIVHLSTERMLGGGEHQLIMEYEGFQKNTHYKILPYIICAKNSKLEALCHFKKYKIFSLKRRGAFSLIYTYECLKIIQDIHKKHNTSIILHAHDAHAHTYALLVQALWKLIYKRSLVLVMSKKVVPPFYTSRIKVFKYSYFGVKKIICVSDAIRNMCAKICRQCLTKKATDEKLVVIPDAVDVKKYEPDISLSQRHFYQGVNSAFTIAIIASLLPVKNHALFLEIATTKMPENCRFWIIGEGPLRAELETKAQHLPVEFLGFREDIPELLNQIDVLLVTSIQEGLCSTILQAFAARVPVIATPVGGIPEIIEDGKTGFLAKDAAQFVRYIHVLYNNAELALKLAEKAWLSVQAYDIHAHLEIKCELYRALV